MPKFAKKQEIFHIGKVDVGGQPGELPTVLIGSIFYEGHKIVKDAINGRFDEEKARKLIHRQEELSERTGNPHMVDVVGLSSTAIARYIDFVADTTNAPILIDSSLAEVKISGIKHMAEVGLLNRAICNSIGHAVKDEEIEGLKNVGVKSAIILAYNPRNVWPQGRIELLVGKESKGLLRIARDAGITGILVDTAVLDVPSIGLAIKAVRLVKEELGLPAGGGPANAVAEWKRIKELGPHAKNVCASSSVTTMQQAGANFILYGPLAKADIVFPAAAMTDAIIAYKSRQEGIKPKTKEHPLYKIF